MDFRKAEFDPSVTLDSGQVFRWRAVDETRDEWIGPVGKSLVRVTKEQATFAGDSSVEQIRQYFSLDEDLDSIFDSFPADETIAAARNDLLGLRLLQQDPWECLISFVCSINCNIPSIKLKLENLSRRYGEKMETGLDLDAYSFPSPESLSKASKRDLLACKLGFRWKYVKFIAKKVAEGHLDLARLDSVPYYDALPELISDISGNTFGVGPKVADCTLLYSLHKTEAFPIDVWILRCLRRFYGDEIPVKNLDSLTPKKYFLVSESMRKKFGKYAGYAQLYMYVKMRGDSNHSM